MGRQQAGRHKARGKEGGRQQAEQQAGGQQAGGQQAGGQQGLEGRLFEWRNYFMRNKAARPLRFAVVGLAATFTHIGLASLILGFEPGANAYLVNLFAYAMGFFVSYFGHRHLTFGTPGSMARFLLVAMAGFGLNNLLISVLLAASASSLVAIVVATAAVPILTYVASSLWVFNRRGRKS